VILEFKINFGKEEFRKGQVRERQNGISWANWILQKELSP
jgi:hypothetical protein